VSTFSGEHHAPPELNGEKDSTRYEYNLDRQLIRTVLPDNSFIEVVYDTAGCGCGGAGKPKTITFDRGTTTFDYDSLTGHLEKITSPEGNSLSYTYDGSLPTSVTWAGEVEGSVSVIYNNDLKVVEQRVNGGHGVSYAYDDDGLLTQAGALSISRDHAIGRITSTTLGSVTTSYTYNAYGEVANFQSKYSNDNLFTTNYSLDSLGRITDITEVILGDTNRQAYSYDLSGRLENVFRNDTLISTYVYDENGNRLSHTTPQVITYGTYDNQDRMLNYGDASFGYTPNGSLKFKVENGDTIFYNYDFYGNLISVNLPDGTMIEYLIDAQNRRIGKKVNGQVVKRWIYNDQLNPVAELDANGNVITRFVYGSKGHVPDYMIRGDSTYYFITDHLGSVRLVVNMETGFIVQQIQYDEFGDVLADTNPDFQPFGYAGGLFDTHTGLVRFGARDYDAEVGRWTAKDPIGFNSNFNFYQYVNNNPINLYDHNGALVEIIIEEGESVGKGMFGHVTIGIGNTVYSYMPWGMEQIQFSEYIDKISRKDAIGFVLDISPCDEKELLQFIIENFLERGNLWAREGFCAGPIRKFLNDKGYDLGNSPFPAAFGQELIESGLVEEYRFYNKEGEY